VRWSFHIARIAGIDVKLHGTFILFLAWIGYAYYRVGGVAAARDAVVLVSLIFLCVLLHEFGHALTARRYGIKTPDITLLPIGGVARLERMPDKPGQEVLVALAGPAVNIVIAAAIWVLLGLPIGLPDPETLRHVGAGLPGKLLTINLWLALFNLIPAFPMDGGRVLRAFLAFRLDYARATHIAASVGQVTALVFGFIGLTSTPMNPMLILIAIFIYFGAADEAAFAQIKQISAGLRVSAAMVTKFQTLPLHSTLNEAVEALLRTSQHEFPVVDHAGKVAGILTRDDLILGLRRSGAETPVAEVMRVGIPAVHHSMLFDKAHALMQECDCPALPVLDSADQLVGLFTPENVGELMLVHSALAKRPPHSGPRTGGHPPALDENLEAKG
jgi:Zn-dependent protease/CBS domain-containing protein